MAEKKKGKKKFKNLLAYLIICISVFMVVVLLDKVDMWDKPEFTTQDLRFRLRGIIDTPDDVVIVAIDSQSLEILGLKGVPPRSYHVPLIENLFRAGAKAVLFDVLFFGYTGETEPGAISPSPSYQDSLLADTFFLYPETIIARKIALLIEEATLQSVGESPLPPVLFQNPNQLAFVDMVHDSDSFVRRARLIFDDMGVDNGWQYSLGMKAAMYALDADTAWVDNEKRVVHVDDWVVPLDDHRPPSMVINFSEDEQTFSSRGGYISYEQVMDPGEFGIGALIESNRIKDKVVLIGATFPESKDSEFTPFYLGTEIFTPDEFPMYGVHVHKNIADTIISGRFIYPAKNWHLIALVALVSLLVTAINYKFRGFIGLFLTVVTIILYSGIALAVFLFSRRLIPIIAPAFATVLVNYMSVVTYNFLTERKQKTMIRGAFSQYVPRSVVDELIKNPDLLTLGGEERIMTVIFTDVAGFTSISENLSPTELVELLNEYLTAMSEIVFAHNGIIDKYEGDAIMAEFGAPMPDDNHAVNACFTAIEMQKQLSKLREKLASEGRPQLRARVGINSGAMVVGNMGSSMTFDYTVMGDNVNLSSRLEGANKQYNTYSMCSEATRKMVEHEVITRELDLLRVKGKTEGVLVHEVLAKKSEGIGEDKQRVIDKYLEGLAAYKERRWDDGIRLFGEAIEMDGDDGPSSVYHDRCKQFKEDPPPDDWDGIFTMRTK